MDPTTFSLSLACSAVSSLLSLSSLSSIAKFPSLSHLVELSWQTHKSGKTQTSRYSEHPGANTAVEKHTALLTGLPLVS